MERVGTLIVGAGVMGAALAYALRERDDVCVLEAESRPGCGISSRNSGVIHAGLYYPEGSLKQKFCQIGAQLLFRFLETHQLPYRRCGKFLVANSDDELIHLDWLEKRNPSWLGLQKVPPPIGVRACRALFSPNTGIVDVHPLIEALLQQGGHPVLFRQKVEFIVPRESGVEVVVNGETYLAKRVANCSGLNAADFFPDAHHYLARGHYFRIKGHLPENLPSLIYPTVGAKSAGLGIHLTRNMVGEAYLGPDLMWVDRVDFTIPEQLRTTFFHAARQYLPWLCESNLELGYAGIRPKLSNEDWSDFRLEWQSDGMLVHLLGFESPGLTAALAVAEHIAQLWQTPH